MKKSQQKQIKAWLLIDKEGRMVEDFLFKDEKEVKDFKKNSAYYKALQYSSLEVDIVPCVISYQLKPLKK